MNHFCHVVWRRSPLEFTLNGNIRCLEIRETAYTSLPSTDWLPVDIGVFFFPFQVVHGMKRNEEPELDLEPGT